MKRTSSMAAMALHTFGARSLAAVISVVTGIIVAKTLGPGGKGVYSSVQVFLAVPIAITAGAGTAITYLMTKKQRAISELVAPLSIVFALLLCASLAGIVAWSTVHGWTLPAIAMAAVLPAAIVLSWQPSIYIGSGRIERLNFQTIGLSALTLVSVGGALLIAHLGVLAAVAAWVACNYFFAAIVVADALREGDWRTATDLRAHLKHMASFGGQSSLNLSLGTLNYRIDSLILAALLGLVSFGIYSIAVNLGELLFSITRPIAAAVSRNIGILDAERAAALTARTIRISSAIVLAISVVIFVFGPWLIDLIYGSRFGPAATPLRLLLPGIVAFATAGTFASFFLFQVGRPSIVTIINVVMIVTQAVACILLVPRFGLAGAAFSSTVTYVLGAAVNTVWFCRITSYKASAVWLPTRADVQAILALIPRTLRRKAPKREPVPRSVRKRILLTGAAGRVATLIRAELASHYDVRLTDVRPIRSEYAGEEFVLADLRELEQSRSLMRGVDTVVHFAGFSKEGPLETLVPANITGTYNVFEAARLEGVRRIIFASTGHVTGFYSREDRVDEMMPPRPDSLYATTKLFGENLARLYADKYGGEILCIRIGHVCAQPAIPIDQSIWLSPEDLVQLIQIGIDAPRLHCEIVYGVSDNVDRWWSLERAEALGYRPRRGCPRFQGPQTHRHTAPLEFQGEAFAAGGLLRKPEVL